MSKYRGNPGILTLRQSELATILTCGRKFELGRVAELPNHGSRSTFMGTAVHKGLESLYRSAFLGERYDLDEARTWTSTSIKTSFAVAPIEALELEDDETFGDVLAFSEKIVLAALDFYIEGPFVEVVSKGSPLAVEEYLEFNYRGFKLTGTLDLMDADGILRDHKTTKAYLPKEMSAPYMSQLARYAWFWFMVTGTKPTAVQIDMLSWARMKTKAQRLDFQSYVDTDMDRLLRLGQESVDQALDQVEMGFFPRNQLNGFLNVCDLCPYKGEACLNHEVVPKSIIAPPSAMAVA